MQSFKYGDSRLRFYGEFPTDAFKVELTCGYLGLSKGEPQILE